MVEQWDSNDVDAAPQRLFVLNTASATGFATRPAVEMRASPEDRFSYRVLKRGLDLMLVCVCLPVLLLFIALIALAIRMTSPGPIFFSHRRIRGHGRFFSMWKFRTMCVNSSEVLESYLDANPDARAEWRKTHKLKNDPRVTPVGEFLRRTSLDELPQIWNVVTGTMSLVGPRPIVAAEVEKYGAYFADYCLVKPGVTGLWQVSGRSQISYPERVQLDRHYAHHWSLLGDVKILLRTLSSVANQDGAY
ncbi:MAG TPA: sugar transferase [Acidobacteriaceae bacterium]|nr:sugar transferase [Acidobacteriaceae bacterium]